MTYPHLSARIFNTPLLIAPGKLDAIIAGLGPRLIGAEQLSAVPAALAPDLDPLTPAAWSSPRGELRRDEATRGRYRLIGHLAVVSVRGVLAHRMKLGANSEMVLGYEQIATDLQAAAADPDVRAILIDADSPGGEVAGAFELASAVRELNGSVPVYVMVDSMAASAMYLIAAQATEIIIAPSGYAGSIGVVMTHVDLSRAMANDGVAVTHIYAGEQKVDGTPYQPLPATVRARFQAEIDTIYGEFVAAVAAGRPDRLTPDAIRATQAGIFRAQAAVDAGLADTMQTADALITRLTKAAASRARTSFARPARSTLNPIGAKSMSEQTDAGVLLTSEPSTTAADLAAARQAGADAERTRIFAILDHAEAKAEGRRDTALVLARNPAMDAATAAAVLATLPAAAPAAAAAPVNALALQMAAMGNPPTMGGDAPADDPLLDVQASWARARGKAA